MTRKQRLLQCLCGHLALLGLVLQAFAFDHMTAGEPLIAGSADYSFHLNHCHGGESGCATQGSDVNLLAEDLTLAIATADWRPYTVQPAEARLIQAFIAIPHQPPQIRES